MGKNLDQFRAKQITGPQFLANALNIELMKISARLDIAKSSVSESVWNDWVREAETLKGRNFEELAEALSWAINDGRFWSEVVTTMAIFVRNVDKILPQYQGAQRKQKILESEESNFGPECQLLQAKYGEGSTRQQIEGYETRERWAKELEAFKKQCKLCKGEAYIPVRLNYPKGKLPPGFKSSPDVPVECRLCREFSKQTYARIRKEVHAELFAPVTK